MFYSHMLLPFMLCVSIGTTLALVSTPVVCEGGQHGMEIHMPVNEFARAYAKTFRMSDGSSIVDSDVNDMEHMDAAFHHMKTLMASVGARRVSC
jgi:hypothetical protein